MNKSERCVSSVILDKYLSVKEPDYAKFMEERLWDNFKDLIIKELKENDSIVVEKVFDMQKALFETNQLQFRQDISITKLIHCKDCKHYKQSAVADRKMCFRKDVDGIEVCYDFLPDDSCTYGERKDGGENDSK